MGQISDIRVILNHGESNILASVSFCWEGMHIDNVKVITDGNNNRFLSYPSKNVDGKRIFSCRPNKTAATIIDGAVFSALDKEKERLLQKFSRSESNENK